MRRASVTCLAAGLVWFFQGCLLAGAYVEVLRNAPLPPEGSATIHGHSWRLNTAGAVLKVNVENEFVASYRNHVLFVPGKKHPNDPPENPSEVRLLIDISTGPSSFTLDPSRLTLKAADGKEVPAKCAFDPGTLRLGDWCAHDKDSLSARQCGADTPEVGPLAVRQVPADAEACFIIVFDRDWTIDDAYEARLDGVESSGQIVNVPVMRFSRAKKE